MAYDETLTARVRQVLGGRSDIAERKMFGGVAFLLNGRMCCGIAGPELVVRVVEHEMAAALARPHVRPMDLTGRPLRGFVFVAPDGCRTDAALTKWVGEGLRFVNENYATSKTARKSAGAISSRPRRKRTTERPVSGRPRR